jgi:DNA-directed RNA polymerase subunit RPC12/RpoP
MSHKYSCPNCGAIEFVTEPNQYDILVFTQNGFETQIAAQIDDYKVFCRECSAEIDIVKSDKKIVVKT